MFQESIAFSDFDVWRMAGCLISIGRRLIFKKARCAFKHSVFFVLSIAGWGIAGPYARAELIFESSHVDLDAGASDASTEAVFGFTNKGRRAVEIREVKSSCDCTTTKLEKRRYDPGETGAIKAVFTFGERVGEQFKQITVKTDEGVESVYRLSFRVRISEWLTAAPIALFWTQGGKAETKTIRVNCPEQQATSVVVTAVFHKVKARVESGGGGQSYEVIVSPKSTGEVFREEILVDAEFPGVGKRTIRCYAYVK
jgi:hypothetical protein